MNGRAKISELYVVTGCFEKVANHLFNAIRAFCLLSCFLCTFLFLGQMNHLQDFVLLGVFFWASEVCEVF